MLGHSQQTVRQYAQRHPTRKFDLIFIDGGHDYDVAKADLLNAEGLAHAETVIIMDDLTPWWDWGIGPTRAWREGIDAGAVTQLGLYRDGRPVSTIEGRGWVRAWGLGQYTFVSGGSAASRASADS